VVHATRQAKTHATPETLNGRWQAEARAFGTDPERLVGQLAGRQATRAAPDARARSGG
jgi:hypothetical protein